MVLQKQQRKQANQNCVLFFLIKKNKPLRLQFCHEAELTFVWWKHQREDPLAFRLNKQPTRKSGLMGGAFQNQRGWSHPISVRGDRSFCRQCETKTAVCRITRLHTKSMGRRKLTLESHRQGLSHDNSQGFQRHIKSWHLTLKLK